jgi:hypothetical protein
MSNIQTILIWSFVRPFYRQHAGFFTFLFLILFGAVGVVDGAGIFDFHYSLILGMLKNPFIFLLIMFLWLLYAKKCEQFVINTLRRPEFSFLQMLSLLKIRKLFRMLVIVQLLLFLPIIVYAMIICVAGYYQHAFGACVIILTYLTSILMLGARWYLYHIQNPAFIVVLKTPKLQVRSVEPAYWTFFYRFISRNKKLLFAGIKIFSCSILFGMLVNQTGTDYEWNMIILFFSIGILGHGLLIHQIRELEETRLTFYRAVPVSLLKRFYQYAIFYFILLLPEITTIATLTPRHLTYADALLLIFFSYSLLLFLHSLLFIQFFPMKDYLKITLLLFLIIYSCLLTGTFLWLCIFILLSSMFIFIGCYYQYERRVAS